MKSGSIVSIIFILIVLSGCHQSDKTIKHVKVFYKPGRFGGWQANNGIWSWGNEILVGFAMGYHKDLGRELHNIDREKPEVHMLARSLDGGETWTVEDPAKDGIMISRGKALHGTEPDSTKRRSITRLREPMDFSRPGFAMKFWMLDVNVGPSVFYYSYDKGHIWKGPFSLAVDSLTKIAARNDYLIENRKSWEYLGKPVDDLGEGNPPCLIRLNDGRLCLTYGYRAEPFSICAKLSEDNGKTWSKPIILRDDGAGRDIGYVRSVQRPDGEIATIYYFQDKEHPERYVGCTIWNPDLKTGQ